MRIFEKYFCLCWYCSKCCDYRKCVASLGIKPKSATYHNGSVVACTNFDRDVPESKYVPDLYKSLGISRFAINSTINDERIDKYIDKVISAIENNYFGSIASITRQTQNIIKCYRLLDIIHKECNTLDYSPLDITKKIAYIQNLFELYTNAYDKYQQENKRNKHKHKRSKDLCQKEREE